MSADRKALEDWAALANAEAERTYQHLYDRLQAELQEHWDGAGFFARIALWFGGEKPENASWWG